MPDSPTIPSAPTAAPDIDTAPPAPAPATSDAPNVIHVDPAAPPDTHPLFTVSPTLAENTRVGIKPVWISLGIEPSAFPTRLGGFSDPSQSPHAQPKGAFTTALRGFGPYADRIWLFKGADYLRYFERPDGQDETSELLSIAGNWNVPAELATGIDATLTGTVQPYQGHVWLFRRGEYIRYDPNTDQLILGPLPIAGNWALPDSFTGGFDAAIHGVGDYLGIVWFFRGAEVVRYDLRNDTVEYGPAPIAAHWNGWPQAFADGVDFAFYGTGDHAEHIYFFRGDEYVRYNLPADRVEEGPEKLTASWPAAARFMPVPQVFLTEQYSLTTFQGEIGNGGMVGVPIKVPGRATTEFYVVTKNSQTIDESSSTNILESSSQKVANNFSDSIRTDESGSESHDNYDYGMNASFHGEAHATGITGGEVNADLHVKGATQDVRRSFANAVGTQLDKLEATTHEEHAQQVSVKDASSHVDTHTETGFKQVIDNSDNPEPLDFVLFQLTQEYVLVLSLVEAQVVFRNGDDRQARAVPIRDMETLFDTCITDPAVRAQAAHAVVTTLTSIVDQTGSTRSLLAPNPTPSSAFIDPGLTTTVPLTNSDGELVPTIKVDGIAISVQRPVVLTPNTALATLHVPGSP
jgi:Hemopexin